MLNGAVRSVHRRNLIGLGHTGYQCARHSVNLYSYDTLLQRRPWLVESQKILCRGAKSKATLQLKDLPQGVLEDETSVFNEKDEGRTYPTVVQQARNNMRKFENCVLLTRVGGFYELYFDHATEYGPLLNLKVAQKRTAAGSVPMAGFPFFQLDRFLKILVQDLNKYVAISEEFANSAAGKVKSGGLLFDRKVTRIVTPGTLVDENFMDPYENNYLLAIHPGRHRHSTTKDENDVPKELMRDSLVAKLADFPIGLAWLDVSTGEFCTQAATMGGLSSAIARIGAKEIVMSNATDDDLKTSILNVLEHARHMVTWQPGTILELPISHWATMLETPIPEVEQAAFTGEETIAGSMLLGYVKERLQGLGIKLQPPIRRQDTENMGIDKNSMKGLELLETSRDGLGGGRGSLLHALRRTVTKSGARLLRSRISSPSTSIAVINRRLDLVDEFLHKLALREAIIHLLRRTYDSQRLVQKFSLGRGDADDLISLSRTIQATLAISTILKRGTVSEEVNAANPSTEADSHVALQILDRGLSLEGPGTLGTQITEAIDEDSLSVIHQSEQILTAEMVTRAQNTLYTEGSAEDFAAMSQVVRSRAGNKISKDSPDLDDTWVMRRSASPLLERLHKRLDELREEQAIMTSDLRVQAATHSLTLRWTPGLGHICHVKGAKDVRISMQAFATARSVSSTKSTRCFYLPEWSNLGGRIDQTKLQIKAEEQRVFQELRGQVVLNLVKLRRNAAVLDELDLACSFALLAEEQGYVRPVLNLGISHKVLGGRHPTVKLGLEEQGRAFVSNDCFVGVKERIWLITGPNMAGKSTFLRQNALISVLAQVGSFVPAEHAEIGIVDQIFSRVGSADNLFQDQSTFMVEMLETAAILKQATRRSFVIMDEVGRGTTPEDGIAVAFACLHHLYHTNKCRSLFATHFHALADMTSGWEGLGCYCTDVAEGISGSFSYDHRLRKGVNRQSHALKVARLAGIPEPAIDVARRVLESSRHFQSDRAEQSLPIAAVVQ